MKILLAYSPGSDGRSLLVVSEVAWKITPYQLQSNGDLLPKLAEASYLRRFSSCILSFPTSVMLEYSACQSIYSVTTLLSYRKVGILEASLTRKVGFDAHISYTERESLGLTVHT